MKKIPIAFLAAATMSACTSVERLRPDLAARVLPSRLDEIAYVNQLRDAFTYEQPNENLTCYDGAELRFFRPRLEQGRPNHTVQQESLGVPRCVRYRQLNDSDRTTAVTRYLEAGFGLTDIYCQRYFTIAAESAQQRNFQRNSFSAADALLNAVLGAASAGETAIGIANAAFEGVDATYRNIDNAFLVAPDLANVRDLVHAAQENFRSRAFAKGALPGSYESARAVIERYAGLCSYTGMRQLVNDSVTSATRAITPAQPAAVNGQTNAGAAQPGQPSVQPSAQAAGQAPTPQQNDVVVPIPVTPRRDD